MRMPARDVRTALRAVAVVATSMVAANVIGAVIIFVYLTMLSPDPPDSPTDAETFVPNVIAFGIFMVGSLVLGTMLSMRAARRTVGWLLAGRPAAPQEQRHILDQPRRQSIISAVMWATAAPVFAGFNLLLGVSAVAAERIFTAVLLTGMTTTATTYLLVERALRPVVALALKGAEAHGRRGFGVLPRLLLSWLLGSGIPLLGVAMAQVRRTPEERAQLAVPTWFLVAVALVVGALVTVVAARSVSDPVNRVRAALERVQAGDVSVEVPVDDGSEIGQLQTGFNAMVAGLRERQVLRDLFGRHVGEDVARAALAGKAGMMTPVQVDASVLFVDLIASTRLTQERSPEDVLAVLNGLFGSVVRVVTAHHGWVNKFDGDGALAVFGPPADVADHATCALAAARALRESVRDLAGQLPGLDVGIGVSSGPVVAGNVGAADRYEYTVIGDPVNEASRLTTLAKQRPSRLCASSTALVAADDDERTRWAYVGEVELRGRVRPTRLFEPAAV